jgi:hypothetical protein
MIGMGTRTSREADLLFRNARLIANDRGHGLFGDVGGTGDVVHRKFQAARHRVTGVAEVQELQELQEAKSCGGELEIHDLNRMQTVRARNLRQSGNPQVEFRNSCNS